MTKVSIEEISGKQCTVIRKPFDAEWVKEQLSMGIPVLAEKKDWKAEGEYGYKNLNLILEFAPYYRGSYWCASECQNKGFHGIGYHKSGPRSIEGSWTYILTILPPLPRNPKLEDAALVSLYKANGIHPHIEMDSGDIVEPYDISGQLFVVQGFDDWHLINDTDAVAYCTLNGKKVDIAIEDKDNE